VRLVELKAGQDSAYFFLQPVVDALTYAADAGIDVVNMSFYLDPWLYNCYANPADSPRRQAEQRTIIGAMRRALDYAHARGVTVVAALGNQHVDLGHPRADKSSPDHPGGSAYERQIDNATCFSPPSRARTCSASGRSGRPAASRSTPTTAASGSPSPRRAAGSPTTRDRAATAT
jgi:lantibiotic leader peptide-processing serine protease